MMRDKVEEALDRIRPRLMLDGVYIELVDVSNNTVEVNLIGACTHCPWTTIIFQVLTERMLQQEMPEIKEVAAI